MDWEGAGEMHFFFFLLRVSEKRYHGFFLIFVYTLGRFCISGCWDIMVLGVDGWRGGRMDDGGANERFDGWMRSGRWLSGCAI